MLKWNGRWVAMVKFDFYLVLFRIGRERGGDGDGEERAFRNIRNQRSERWNIKFYSKLMQISQCRNVVNNTQIVMLISVTEEWTTSTILFKVVKSIEIYWRIFFFL